jgi:hypothetical protein
MNGKWGYKRRLTNLGFSKLKVVILLLFPHLLYSQGEFDNWYFGEHAGLNFNSGLPVVLTNCATSFFDDCTTATSSDSLGNLLFYSNHFRVYNRNNVVMPNGNGLNSNGSVDQPVLPVESLSNDSLYFLFTIDKTANSTYPNPFGLRYSVIDMRLNGGLGDIVTGQKNLIVPGAQHTSNMLTGTRHSNNRDVWIVVRNFTNDNFLTYSITSSGIELFPVVSHSLIPITYPPGSNDTRMLKISPDGLRIVALYDTVAEFCKFNDTLGGITPLFKFQSGILESPYYWRSQAEFSLDSKFLYISCYNGDQVRRIYQYNASLTDSAQFKQSEQVIYSYATIVEGSYGMQRASDHKIYCTVPYKDSLNVINTPTAYGPGCNFQVNAICLLPTNNAWFGFPQNIQKYFVYTNHTGQCQNKSIGFNSNIWPPADSLHWDFGDPPSAGNNFSNLPSPIHTYSTSGSYQVMLIVRHNDNRMDTGWRTITIFDSPHPTLGQDRSICTGDSVMLDAGSWINSTYAWDNLTAGQYNISTFQNYWAKTAGSYRVTVTNSNSCIGMDTVMVNLSSPPDVTNNPMSKSICSGESTNIPLTSSVPAVNFHWTATLTSGTISGFSADSGTVINQVLTNPLASPGIVTYHITPKIGSCSGPIVDFPVTVNPGVPVSISISASQNNVCAGTMVTFTATPGNQGASPIYQWKVNSINQPGNSTTFSYTPINNDVVTCLLTSSNTVCTSNNPATSNAITMTINPNLPVSITITPDQNPICAGLPITFTAFPIFGGTTPSYQWKVNGINVGVNSINYTYIPLNGDLVSCTLQSSETCTTNNPASSIQYPVSVNPILPVSVTISPSQNPFCVGSPVTFTAVPGNGGITPIYQWKVNGVNAGTNSQFFTYNPLNNDQVSCILISSEPCPSGNPASSISITMIQNNSLPASVSITASSNPFCPGSSVTFTATPINGGPLPGYQWKVNGVKVGINSNTYTYNPTNGDSVRCIMTSSLACVTGSPCSSAKIILSGTLAPAVTFTACFDTITTIERQNPLNSRGGIPLRRDLFRTGSFRRLL